MANLSWLERRNLEKLLDMGGGYVLNFSNRTFQGFVKDCTGKDIYDSKYMRASGSKANCLRGFLEEESNYVVGRLLTCLLDYYRTLGSVEDPELYSRCLQAADRLSKETPVPDAEIILDVSSQKGFETVAKAVQDAIEKNQPDQGLDRLHTFMTKYVRLLCTKYGITVEKEKPLHSLFGEYVKHLNRAGRLKSEMTERILKSSISILDAFNDVRNNQSLAHDNPVLNYSESLLIFRNVTASIQFLSALENEGEKAAEKELINELIGESTSDEIPF
jgi:hypothetical protein